MSGRDAPTSWRDRVLTADDVLLLDLDGGDVAITHAAGTFRIVGPGKMILGTDAGWNGLHPRRRQSRTERFLRWILGWGPDR